MSIFDFTYFNFYSTGSLIATIFNIVVALFFLIWPKKTRATKTLIFVYFFIMFQNIGYLITSTIYHPLSAYHRWITIFSVIPGLIYIERFFFFFPDERNTSTARVILLVQWAVSIAVDIVFALKSLTAEKIFRFDGHYWDFDLDPLSYAVSIVIIFYIITIIATGIWRIVVTASPGRKQVLYMLICFMVISVLPGIANSLSREGTIQRDTFQVTWNLITVLGFFLTVTVYTNVTKNRTSIMTTIVGISLVAFLLVFQGLSYYTSLEREESYDLIQKQKLARLILDPRYEPPDIRYLVYYTPQNGDQHTSLVGDVLPIRENINYELANTLLYEKMAAVPDTTWITGIQPIIGPAHPYFKGYRLAIEQIIRSAPPERRNKAGIMAAIDALNTNMAYHRAKISRLPYTMFRKSLLAYLARTNASMMPFKQVLMDTLKKPLATDTECYDEAMKYLAPLSPAGARHYRLGISDEHFIAFTKADLEQNRLYEAGFSYFYYRAFIHNSSIKLVYVLGAVIMLMLIGFPLFFRGTLVRPLHDLLKGITMVNNGNLEASVPVKMDDEIGFLTGAFNDMVASVKDTNEKIDTINHYLKNIIDSMPSVVVGVDVSGKVTHWNMAAENKTGKNEEEVMGRYLGSVFPMLEQYMSSMWKAINRREPQKLEKIIQREMNETTISDLLIYPLIADGIEGAVIRIDDITSRVRLEEMMIQTEKMMSVGGLAAGMAHEINNPLSGILLATQNIQRRLSPDIEKNIAIARDAGVDLNKMHAYLKGREIPRMLEDIREMGERASKIVSNMLSFSRRSESRWNVINLAELLEKTVELAASDYDLKKSYDFRHIEIARDFADHMPDVECMAVEIQQVVLNILRNAAQAIHGKSYPKGEHPAITLRLTMEGASARIDIEDNGPGMAEELRRHIFEPFFTTKDTGVGTGLGLSVSYFIITNNHRGTIAVDSEINRGTRFIITIPVKREML